MDTTNQDLLKWLKYKLIDGLDVQIYRATFEAFKNEFDKLKHIAHVLIVQETPTGKEPDIPIENNNFIKFEKRYYKIINLRI